MFDAMLESVLGAPISYFESTPMGRILNRFTYDMEVMDITLTQNMGMFLISTGWYVTGVAIMLTILPWTALAVVPVSLLYVSFVMHYRMSGPDLQRLDASSRSPVQAMVSEGTNRYWYHLPLVAEPSHAINFHFLLQVSTEHQQFEYSEEQAPSFGNFEGQWIKIVLRC